MMTDDNALSALFDEQLDGPVVFLHSGRFHPKWARRSLLGKPVAWFRYYADRHSELLVDDKRAGSQLSKVIESLPLTHKVWSDLRMLLNCPALPGYWVGYISYDIGRVIEPGKLASRADEAGGWSLVELGYCPTLTEFAAPDIDGAKSVGTVGTQSPDFISCKNLTADFTPPQYKQAVKRVLDYIGAGDVFQVNLTQRFQTTYQGNLRQLFAKLASVSPAWYGAYLELGTQQKGEPQRAICSTSPELFLEMKNRHIVTRPIKGTRPNRNTHTSSSSSDANYNELLHSEKDKAELAMIVDLLRNDLGRVCSYGSIKVVNPREIETHPTVHHTTATITGQLHEAQDVVSLLKATLPGGSITGAPKVRAMQIIDELEPVVRGPYCGCIGYLSKDDICLNLAIRTMVIEEDAQCPQKNDTPNWRVSFHVGGGIVADSEPGDEYDETLSKAQAMLRALERS